MATIKGFSANVLSISPFIRVNDKGLTLVSVVALKTVGVTKYIPRGT